MTLEEQYYIRHRGTVQGPYTFEKLRELAIRGRFSKHYFISSDQVEWRPAKDHPELFARIPRMPVEIPIPLEPTIDLNDVAEDEFALDETRELFGSSEETSYAEDESFEESIVDDSTDCTWYFESQSKPYGPKTFSQLQTLATTGVIEPDNLVWAEGMDKWVQANQAGLVFPERQESEANVSTVSQMAVKSFIFGLLGTCLLLFVGSIVAVVFGHVAMRQINESMGVLSGKGMALTGLILGYLMIVVVTIAGIVSLSLYLSSN